MNPIGLHETAAKAFLGVPDKRWRTLKADGIVTPLPFLGSYSVQALTDLVEILRSNPEISRDDLKGLIKNGNAKNRWAIHQSQETQSSRRDQQADSRLRAKPRRGRSRSSAESSGIHPLDL